MKNSNIDVGDLVTYGKWYRGGYRLGLVIDAEYYGHFEKTGDPVFAFYVWWSGPNPSEWELAGELKLVSKKI